MMSTCQVCGHKYVYTPPGGAKYRISMVCPECEVKTTIQLRPEPLELEKMKKKFLANLNKRESN
ncbi:MAG: hypothetical protein GY756_17335 [bacterium]|nr:hypothetical protein [bacterium]